MDTDKLKEIVVFCRQNNLLASDIFQIISLQCFDAVGWVAGRASGL